MKRFLLTLLSSISQSRPKEFAASKYPLRYDEQSWRLLYARNAIICKGRCVCSLYRGEETPSGTTVRRLSLRSLIAYMMVQSVSACPGLRIWIKMNTFCRRLKISRETDFWSPSQRQVREGLREEFQHKTKGRS